MTPTNNSVYESAKEYLAKGWSVIPIKHGEKKPNIAWDKYQHCLPSEAEIRKWFESTDNQIAVIGGKVSSGLFILDFDGPQWEQALSDFHDLFPEFLDTLQVKTGSGRLHLYGRTPDISLSLTKKVRVMYPGDKKTAVELRANEHYTLCPPSLHPSGDTYDWINDSKEVKEIVPDRFQELADWVQFVGNSEEPGELKANGKPEETEEQIVVGSNGGSVECTKTTKPTAVLILTPPQISTWRLTESSPGSGRVAGMPRHK